MFKNDIIFIFKIVTFVLSQFHFIQHTTFLNSLYLSLTPVKHLKENFDVVCNLRRVFLWTLILFRVQYDGYNTFQRLSLFLKEAFEDHRIKNTFLAELEQYHLNIAQT